MSPALPVEIAGQHCWLSPDRCLFWEEARTLVVTDLHFGKTGHFRREGIAIPQAVYMEDLQRLMVQIGYFAPTRIIFTGDLFHSVENSEHMLFARWRSSIQAELMLVRGNHDILKPSDYSSLDISVKEGSYTESVFRFVHDPADSGMDSGGLHSICGHLHPGIRLSGVGKQSLRLPCFLLMERMTLLPAFSKFTGIALVEPVKGDRVFAILPDNPRKGERGSVIRIQ
jgi:DNA ligase-associated metallophosphoesterase